ncbi:hypothetical protein BH24ACI4_BH24ACI4_09130 [soil metagenome]
MTRVAQVLAATAAGAFFSGLVLAAQGTPPPTPAQTAPGAGSGMSAEEILQYHSKDEKGGSPEGGRPIYEKLCASCHIYGALGREVGPDLTTISSRFKKVDMLDSILYPSKVISDQYKSEMIELTSGKVITGVLVRESAAMVVVRTADSPDKPVSVPKGQIAERGASPVSLMPEGLLAGLSHTEIADLLAFLLAPPPAK